MLHIHELAKHGQQITKVTVNERLPDFIIGPCHLTASYHVESKDDYYLIDLSVEGDLRIICQRCMQEFDAPYDNKTLIAVCQNDDRAEQLLDQYECIVSSNWQVNLDELIIDELHLYAPQFHSEVKDCDSEIIQILSNKNDAY